MGGRRGSTVLYPLSYGALSFQWTWRDSNPRPLELQSLTFRHRPARLAGEVRGRISALPAELQVHLSVRVDGWCIVPERPGAGVADGCRTRAFGFTIRRAAVELRPPRAGVPALGRRERSAPAAGGRVCPPGRGFTPRRPGTSPSASLVSVHRPPFPLDGGKRNRPARQAARAGRRASLPWFGTGRLPRTRSESPAAKHVAPPVLPAAVAARHFHRRRTMIAARPIGARRSQPRHGQAGRGVEVRGLGERLGHRDFYLRFVANLCSAWHQQKKSRVLMPPVHANVVRGPALRTAERLAIIGTRLPRRGSLHGPPTVVNPLHDRRSSVQDGHRSRRPPIKLVRTMAARMPPLPGFIAENLRRNCFPLNVFVPSMAETILLCNRCDER